MNFLSHMPIFFRLLKTDLILIRKTLKDKLINSAIWASTVIFVTAYILPSFGLSDTFANIQAVSVMISVVGFGLYLSIASFFADYEGDRYVSYLLTLPMPSWMVFLNKVVVFVIDGIILGFTAFCIAKLLLWNSLSLAMIAIPQALVIFFTISFFFGFFGLFMISLIKGLMSIENVFMRVMYPLWFLGGFQFTWHALYDLFPSFAYLNLLNPYIYGQEGIRAAMLGQKGYLPISVCFIMLILMTAFCAVVSLKRLRKKLDFV